MPKIKYYQKPEKNRQDSFWFDGVIAAIGKYLLIATGEIGVTFPDRLHEHDYDAVKEALQRKWHDKDLMKLEWDNNNWFEVIYGTVDKNNIIHMEDCEMGDVAYDYAEGIERLKIYVKEDYYTQEGMKPCAICQTTFRIPKNAKTAEERTLCFGCKKAVKKLNRKD